MSRVNLENIKQIKVTAKQTLKRNLECMNSKIIKPKVKDYNKNKDSK